MHLDACWAGHVDDAVEDRLGDHWGAGSTSRWWAWLAVMLRHFLVPSATSS